MEISRPADTFIANWTHPVKRRQALLESNPPRDSRCVLIADDEGGRGVKSRPAAKPGADQREAPHGFNRRMVLTCPIGPIDRACLRKLISKSDAACGFLILQNLAGFKLRRWHIPERGVKPLLIVDLVQKLGDAGACFPQVAVFAAVDLFVLECFHK